MVGTPPSSPSAVTGPSLDDLLADKEAALAAAAEATSLAKERPRRSHGAGRQG